MAHIRPLAVERYTVVVQFVLDRAKQQTPFNPAMITVFKTQSYRQNLNSTMECSSNGLVNVEKRLVLIMEG